jgi:hypothetical protein
VEESDDERRSRSPLRLLAGGVKARNAGGHEDATPPPSASGLRLEPSRRGTHRTVFPFAAQIMNELAPNRFGAG